MRHPRPRRPLPSSAPPPPSPASSSAVPPTAAPSSAAREGWFGGGQSWRWASTVMIQRRKMEVNQDNFLIDVGMNPVLESSSFLTGSQLMHHGSLKSNSTALLSFDIDEFMNQVITPMLEIIPKSIVWGEATLEVYEQLKADFMKPVIDAVDELLARGINVTIYQGQLDVIVPAVGAEAWVKKLKWYGINQFLSMRRTPLHYCDTAAKYCSQQIRAYVRSYENLAFYWILGAGHMVPVDQPYPAFRTIASITNSSGDIDDVLY